VISPQNQQQISLYWLGFPMRLLLFAFLSNKSRQIVQTGATEGIDEA
jgi:hypothetical protein